MDKNYNITQKIKIILLHYLNRQSEIEKIYDEIYAKISQENLEIIIDFANLAYEFNDDKQLLQIINKALKIIESVGVSTKNISIFKKIILRFLPYIRIENIEKLKYIDKLWNYYEENCLENYEEIEETFLKLSMICNEINETEKCQYYLKKIRKIAIERFGKKSVQVSKIDNQLESFLTEVKK